jgi:hypothetical protein
MRPKYRIKLAAYREYVESQWPAANLDFSEDAAQACFDYESQGKGNPGESNGFLIGKRWLDWQKNFDRGEYLNGLLTYSEAFKTGPDELYAPAYGYSTDINPPIPH